ncbi:Ankyrin repeat and KAP P-loop domain and Ankyrin repeat-containing domain-containing protein [Strongyloides ratti]|uniref:Ankyrin repeat and KAP P-loop domain and Ankyrin repeat-containing domain-containing protein n=1 Tax=Strongyloides ratti TaxID=34506 RepID=A0A090MU03_STRRB|nr:Ankyrin repeat and KAP P-loop domain and Ankyrin repeat-containing domain-containing protein [Strongyloides ratti]CEF61893.1 Ankyrin repeat and KAP P-loop domain and Ankyrin repeat-containing domain-containing protein [Strongyloides ratti]
MPKKDEVTIPLQEYNSQLTVTSFSGVLSNFADIALGTTHSQGIEFFHAVEDGLSDQLAGLHKGHCLSLKNSNGETLLIVAARFGHIDIVKKLVEDSDVDETDNEGWSALLNAAQNGFTEICDILIQNGASVDLSDLMGWTPLMWAVYNNHPDTVNLLLENKAHPNTVDEEDGLTPLILAAGRGFEEVANSLLKYGGSTNACDKFGSTPLIWASRKGFLNIVEKLLSNGCELDAVGMHGSTALMLATKGNFVNVVEKLLAHDPNVNVCDLNGQSALATAAREGYADIVELLIQSGAFVNLVDRYGNSILASAIRSGNINIVRLLLDKYADVNAKDSENRTPLHLAIDKSYIDMVALILEKKPNLEVKNNEGETPLFRAVKTRHVAITQLLLNAGAKVSCYDNYNDNPLHLAIKARSQRLTKLLLTNPADSRLLYRPNKLGETPYSLDQSNPAPVIPIIFGQIDGSVEANTMLGYDIYSDVLADILCDPVQNLPMTVGFFAKWGSGKSLLLPKMRDSMKYFARNWLESVELTLSYVFIIASAIFTAIFCVVGTTLASISGSQKVVNITAICIITVYIIIILSYLLLYYCTKKTYWKSVKHLQKSVAKFLRRLRLVVEVLSLNSPERSHKELIASPVCFLFADDHKLSSVGGHQSFTVILKTLYEAIEDHYGSLAVRLIMGISPTFRLEKQPKYRRYCGVPILITSIFTYIFLGLGCIFATKGFLEMETELEPSESNFIISGVFIILFLLFSIYPIYVIFYHVILNSGHRRMQKLNKMAPEIPFETLIHKMQNEVRKMSSAVLALDSFTNSQTRLVVMVDGMENNEREKIVKMLDTLTLLFGTEPKSPFVLILAVDRHVIVRAAAETIKTTRAGVDRTGHDYVKNIVTLPFYIHNQNIRKMIKDIKAKAEKGEWVSETITRRDTLSGSRMSLTIRDTENMSRKNFTLQNDNHQNAGKFLYNDDYFSNINPNSLRRISNSTQLSGRLLRSFDVDFSWVTLSVWIGLIEQWPFRMAWLLEKGVSSSAENVTLYDIFLKLRHRIPVKHPLAKLDKSQKNFEKVLKKSSQLIEPLTAGKIRLFIPCSCNFDPYLKKLVTVEFISDNDDNLTEFNLAEILFNLTTQSLLKDKDYWNKQETVLTKMGCSEVVSFVEQLQLPDDRIKNISKKVYDLNLSGIVLLNFNLDELQKEMNIPIGDWGMFKLLVETLRKATRRKVLNSMSIAAATQEVKDRINVAKQQMINEEAPESAAVQAVKVKKLIKAQSLTAEVYDELYTTPSFTAPTSPTAESYKEFSRGPMSVKSVRNEIINEEDEIDSNKSDNGSNLLKFDSGEEDEDDEPHLSYDMEDINSDDEEEDKNLEEVRLLSKEHN